MDEIKLDVKELTINAIIRLCTHHSHTVKPCKDCPVGYLCHKYFISLPKYWKLPKEKQEVKHDNKT